MGTRCASGMMDGQGQGQTGIVSSTSSGLSLVCTGDGQADAQD